MSTDNVVTAEMPKYISHKTVWALKISSVSARSDGALLSFEDGRYAPIVVDSAYVNKHAPKAGGYYVVYKDGYQSWSPQEAFESGYTSAERDPLSFEAVETYIRGLHYSADVSDEIQTFVGGNIRGFAAHIRELLGMTEADVRQRCGAPEQALPACGSAPTLDPILKFFEYAHLPERLQDVSRPFNGLAAFIASGPDNAESAVALRKLLEAKDAAVRARL